MQQRWRAVKDNLPRYTLRINPVLLDKIAYIAESEGRSKNREIEETCHIGKWHVTENPLQNGMDINIAGNHIGHPKSYFSPYGMEIWKNGPEGEFLMIGYFFRVPLYHCLGSPNLPIRVYDSSTEVSFSFSIALIREINGIVVSAFFLQQDRPSQSYC